MTTPSGDEPDKSDTGDAPFDPYRFGRPDHPVPPEYAPPGYVPDPPVQGAPTHPYQPYNQPYSQQPYPQQPYPHPYGGYGQQPPWHGYQQPGRSNGKAITAMVLGIMSILLCWLSFLDLVLIVPAIVFGVLGLGESRQRNREGRGMAIAGLACAGVGLLAATLLTVAFVHVTSQCGGYAGPSDPGFKQCVQDHI